MGASHVLSMLFVAKLSAGYDAVHDLVGQAEPQ